jgi:hypothetical protein
LKKSFERMAIIDGVYTVNRKRPFLKTTPFRTSQVATSFDFAIDMTFGAVGEHRNHRTGGIHKRSLSEIFVDTFQGKLAEFALWNLWDDASIVSPPDLSTHKLGSWETADFVFGEYRIAVKSTKWFGNLLLLEAADWDEQGRYVATFNQPVSYSHIVLVRLGPDLSSVIRSHKISLNRESLTQLQTVVTELRWSYDIAGWVSSADLQLVISKDLRIEQGESLGNTVMDATNFYVQTGDLRPSSTLLDSMVP